MGGVEGWLYVCKRGGDFLYWGKRECQIFKVIKRGVRFIISVLKVEEFGREQVENICGDLNFKNFNFGRQVKVFKILVKKYE